MARSSRFSPEVRERAVRMVFEHTQEHASQWAAITSIAEKIGCAAETLRSWVRQAERDQGQRPGLTTEERQRLKQLERENVELRRANEILKKAAGVFRSAIRRVGAGADWGRPPPWSCECSSSSTSAIGASMSASGRCERASCAGPSAGSTPNGSR